MAEFDKNLTLDELKTIIHGLRMSGFSSVEPEALSQIQFRIKNLPVSEEMDKLADDPVSLKNIVHEIGEIMRLLDIYGSKNSEYKARFQSLKGLPPRYKVLEWKSKPENNMNKAASIAKELVRLSSEMDEKGQIKISQKMIVCAKYAMNDELDGRDFQELDSMMKEAGIGKMLGNVWDKAKEMVGQDEGAKKQRVEQKVQQQQQKTKQQEQRTTYNNIYKNLSELVKISPNEEVDPDKIAKLVEGLGPELAAKYNVKDIQNFAIQFHNIVNKIPGTAKAQLQQIQQSPLASVTTPTAAEPTAAEPTAAEPTAAAAAAPAPAPAAPAPAAPAPAAPAPAAPAPAPAMINKKIQQQLKGLGYSNYTIQRMNPADAINKIQNNIKPASNNSKQVLSEKTYRFKRIV